jgi:hypothetical protein
MSKGLLTLQTDLKSLRYGNDKPYVTKDINNPPSSNPSGMQGTKRIDDLSRIAQMLVDRPGLQHLGNEALLRQVGVQDRFEKSRASGKSIVGSILKEIGGTAVSTVKIVGSTLAQVPVNGTGTHFLRGFRTDTYLQPRNANQFSQFARFFGAGGVEGAPSAIRGREILGTVQSSLVDSESVLGNPTNPKTGAGSKFQYNAPVKDNRTSFDFDWNELINKKTRDSFAPEQNSQKAKDGNVIPVVKKEKVTQTTAGLTVPGSDFDQPASSSINIQDSKETTLTPGSLGGKAIDGIVSDYNGPTGLIQDPYNQYGEGAKNYLRSKINYKSLNKNITKEARILLGDQGARRDMDKMANRYWVTGSAATDRINSLAPSTAGKVGDSGKVNGDREGRDLIKFRFHIITPDQAETVLYFRAFLDSFADNYSAQWNPVKYLGRGEDFQIYGGFQRKISLSFKIAAATREEMQPIYEKMIWLASATAPTYADGGQFMRGTLTKITVGDYVYELPGVLNSVNYTWNPDYPWEIAMTEPEAQGIDDFEQELPMVMDCSIDFTPIHQFTPTTGLRKYITTGTTEKGKKGIQNIEKEETGTGVAIQQPPAKDVQPPPPPPTYRPVGIFTEQEFGPQLPGNTSPNNYVSPAPNRLSNLDRYRIRF